LLKSAEYKVKSDTALFSLNINHGKNPQNQQYAYIIKPNMSQPGDADKYRSNIPVKIISNTTAIQAVQHNTLNLTEAIFYQPGDLIFDNGDILSVDKPCALVWNPGLKKINVANPYCETTNPDKIKIRIKHQNHTSEIVIALPQNEFSGKSVSKKI